MKEFRDSVDLGEIDIDEPLHKRSDRAYNESQRAKAIRKERKEKGLCTKCGQPLDREGTRCTKCYEDMKKRQTERREYLLSLGLCPVCGLHEIYGTERSCLECRAKRANQASLSGRKSNERQKRMTDKRRSQGLCPRCGKNKPEEGYVHCKECLAKMKRKRLLKGKRYIREEWKSEGRCAGCGAEELVPGHKVCKRCYAIKIEAMSKCRAKTKEGYNGKWKATNGRLFSNGQNAIKLPR